MPPLHTSLAAHVLPAHYPAVRAQSSASLAAAQPAPPTPVLSRLLPRGTFLTPATLLPDQEPLAAHMSPANLSVIAAKSAVITLAQRTSHINRRVEELEARDEFPEDLDLADVFSPTRAANELNVWNGFLPAVRNLFTRDVCILSALRVYEHWIGFYAPYKLARSLTKSPQLSALRKAARGMSAPVAAAKMFSSALKAQVLYWAALFTVSVAHDAYVDRRSLDLRTFADKVRRQASRCALGCVVAGAGAAIGTLLKPGLGTTIGVLVLPNAVFAVT